MKAMLVNTLNKHSMLHFTKFEHLQLKPLKPIQRARKNYYKFHIQAQIDACQGFHSLLASPRTVPCRKS